MSKKNKNKFKNPASRQIKNQVLNEISKSNSPAIISPSAINTANENAPSIKTKQTQQEPVNYEVSNLPQIKYDLKKTGIVVASLAICIVVLSLLDQKYHILTQFGGWLFKVLNIN